MICLISLSIVLGHKNIKQNKLADGMAKKAAEEKVQRMLTPFILSSLLQTARQISHLRTANFSAGKKNLRTQPHKVSSALAQLEKGEAAMIFHLRSGHLPLNAYLHQFNHHATGKCDHCRVPETVAHFLLHCTKFRQQRKELRELIKEEEIKVNPYSLPSLLDTEHVYPLLAKFVIKTGGFQFLRTYKLHEENITSNLNKKHNRQ